MNMRPTPPAGPDTHPHPQNPANPNHIRMPCCLLHRAWQGRNSRVTLSDFLAGSCLLPLDFFFPPPKTPSLAPSHQAIWHHRNSVLTTQVVDWIEVGCAGEE